jgi:amino acid permease
MLAYRTFSPSFYVFEFSTDRDSSIFFTLFFGWKILKKTKFRNAKEIDLDTGRQLDESTDYAEKPKNLVDRLWAWAA